MALDRNRRGRWRDALCEDESRRCALTALRVSREKDAMAAINSDLGWQAN